jgi:hypothetical protein
MRIFVLRFKRDAWRIRVFAQHSNPASTPPSRVRKVLPHNHSPGGWRLIVSQAIA